jgi:hypothetical protein
MMIDSTSMDAELKDWQFNAGATEKALRDAAVLVGHLLPQDYVQFFLAHNGWEGFVGDNYLILWKTEELSTFNREYEVDQYAPGLVLFGSNGCGEGYAFDTRSADMPIVRVPFIGMDLQYVTPTADSFSDLFIQLAK